MLGNRPMNEWIADYAKSHTHPVNRLCHTFGIPLVALSALVGLATLAYWPLWPAFATLFVVGWVIQFVGHWYEGKPPEFLSDWRFLFVGLRWWFMKLRGQA
jgi:uncharacterized membrane protein YGL010W